jgi:hypothetical protein
MTTGRSIHSLLGFHENGSDCRYKASNHQHQYNYPEQPPIPLHSNLLVWQVTEFFRDEFIVIEILIRKIQAILHFVLFP